MYIMPIVCFVFGFSECNGLHKAVKTLKTNSKHLFSSTALSDSMSSFIRLAGCDSVRRTGGPGSLFILHIFRGSPPTVQLSALLSACMKHHIKEIEYIVSESISLWKISFCQRGLTRSSDCFGAPAASLTFFCLWYWLVFTLSVDYMWNWG